MKILIIEDEPDLRETIQKFLLGERYIVETAATMNEGLDKALVYDYDCILLDIMLPDGNGLTLLKELKKRGKTENLIIISAKDAIEDKVQGIELGADDYISKPFKTVELMARMKANIRRIGRNISSGSISHDQKIEIGGISIDPYTKSVFAAGEPIDLTQKEFELLYNLMLEPDRVFTKEILFSTVWQDPGYVDENTINVHISRLRNKVKNVSGIDPVRTIWGIGLKFYAE